jgi:hypothetical protein
MNNLIISHYNEQYGYYFVEIANKGCTNNSCRFHCRCCCDEREMLVSLLDICSLLVLRLVCRKARDLLDAVMSKHCVRLKIVLAPDVFLLCHARVLVPRCLAIDPLDPCLVLVAGGGDHYCHGQMLWRLVDFLLPW